MALDPSTKYPGQVNTSDPTGYPCGRARNEGSPGARNGTPLEEAWVSDVWGMLQALLTAAGITPSGTPDKVGASQYLTALRTLLLDGQSGGTYAPAAPIIIGGDGINLTGSAHFDGAVEFNDETRCTGGLEVVGGSFVVNDIPDLNPYVTVTRIQPLILMGGEGGGGAGEIPDDWYFNIGVAGIGWFQKTSGAVAYFALTNIPDQSTLTAIRVTCSGRNYSSLPSGMPTISLFYANGSGASVQPAPTNVVDSSTPVAAFNTAHQITQTLSTPLAIDNSSSPIALYLRVAGVNGGFEAGEKFHVISIECDFECSQINPIDAMQEQPPADFLNMTAVRHRLPLIHASVGEMDGLLTTFWPGQGPCLACFLPDAPLPRHPALMGPLPGIMGALMSLEALRNLGGLGLALVGRLMTFKGRWFYFKEERLKANPRCPVCRHLQTQ